MDYDQTERPPSQGCHLHPRDFKHKEKQDNSHRRHQDKQTKTFVSKAPMFQIKMNCRGLPSSTALYMKILMFKISPAWQHC